MSFSRFCILFWEAGNKLVRYRRKKCVWVLKSRGRTGIAEFIVNGELGEEGEEDRAVNKLSDEGDARSASRENRVSVPAAYTALFNCGDRWDDDEIARIQDERWDWRKAAGSYTDVLGSSHRIKTMALPTFFLFPVFPSASLYEDTIASQIPPKFSSSTSSAETFNTAPRHSNSVSTPILWTLNGHRTEKQGRTSTRSSSAFVTGRSLSRVRIEMMIGASGVRLRREPSQTLRPRAPAPTLPSKTLRRRDQYRASTTGLSLVHRLSGLMAALCISQPT